MDEIAQKYPPTPLATLAGDTPPEVGTNCFAELQEGEGAIFPVTILATRRVDPHALPAIAKGADHYEYHVHYDHLDRRMDKWVKRTMIVFFDELGIEERAQVQLRLAKLAQLIAQHNPLVAAANRSTGRGSNRAVLAAQAQVAAAQAAIEAAEAAAREARQMNFSSAPMTPSFDAGYPTDADMMSMEEQRTSLLSPSPVQSSWRAGRLNTARSTSKTAMPDFDMSEAAEEIESGNESEEEDEEQYASRESDEDAEAVDGDGGDTDSGSDEVSNSSGRDSDANDPLQIMMTSGVSNPSAAQKNQPSRCATGAGRVGRLGAYELIIPEHVDPDEDEYAKRMAVMVRNIDHIHIGKFDVEAWYYSPFPIAEDSFNRRLYICEFCLSFFGHESELRRHTRKCNLRHPPGQEIYRSEEQNVNISVFEVDGLKERVYCENLSLISKLFLDHKWVQGDTSPFLFYVVTEVDSQGCHFVAYFSKEKYCACKYLPKQVVHNLACILTLPCHQKKGYGKFIISLSYELSKIEKKVGTPEAPISDLGQVSYDSYWKDTLLELLAQRTAPISVQEMSQITKMYHVDIQKTLLENLKVIRFHGPDNEYKVDFSGVNVDQYLKKKQIDPKSVYVRPCDGSKLHWTPFK